MQTLNIHDVPNHLLRLTNLGEPFIIAQAGKPLAKVLPYAENKTQSKRIGFLKNIAVPDDFDDVGGDEIAALFAGADDEILA